MNQQYSTQYISANLRKGALKEKTILRSELRETPVLIDFYGKDKKKPGAGGYTGLPLTKVLRSGEKPKDKVYKYNTFLRYVKYF